MWATILGFLGWSQPLQADEVSIHELNSSHVRVWISIGRRKGTDGLDTFIAYMALAAWQPNRVFPFTSWTCHTILVLADHALPIILWQFVGFGFG
jgi:hypothetical protein